MLMAVSILSPVRTHTCCVSLDICNERVSYYSPPQHHREASPSLKENA